MANDAQVASTKTMLIQLFEKDSPIFDDSTRDHHRRWQQYMTSFASLEPTDGVSDAVMRARLPVLPAHARNEHQSAQTIASGYGGISSGSSSSGAGLAVDNEPGEAALVDRTTTLPALLTRSLGFVVSFESYRLLFQPDMHEGIITGEAAWSNRYINNAGAERGAAGAALLVALGTPAAERAVATVNKPAEDRARENVDVQMSEPAADNPDETMADAPEEQTAPTAVSAPADAPAAAIAPVDGAAVGRISPVAEIAPVVGNVAVNDTAVERAVSGSPTAGGSATTAGAVPETDDAPVIENADENKVRRESPAGEVVLDAPKTANDAVSAPADDQIAPREKTPVVKNEAATDDAPAAPEAPASPIGNGEAPAVDSEADAIDEAVMTSAVLPEQPEEMQEANNENRTQAVAPAVQEEPSANGEKEMSGGEKEVDGDVEMGGVE
jgi:hypothetical protein